MSDPVFTCLDCGERFASRGAAFRHVDANPTHGIGGTVFAELSQTTRVPASSTLCHELAQAGIAFVLAEREEEIALDRCGEIRRGLLEIESPTKRASAELEVAIGFARKCGEIVTRRESEWKALARRITSELEGRDRG
jgi:hypothetical protein